MQPPEVIDAGELVLRRWEPAWAQAVSQAVRASLPELMPFMPWATGDYDIDTAREYLLTTDTHWRNGEGFGYAVFDAAGELVGSASLMTRLGPGTLEIGYWIHSGHTGRGYATAATAALARLGLSMPGTERLVIRHDLANPASGRVAAKAGFTEVGRVEHDRGAPGSSGTYVIWELRPALPGRC